jgi:hypothetical protein
MIPRKIHYCWFGGKPLPLQARRCLASWAYHLPDYQVVRWDERSFDVNSHPFPAAAYAAERYAFVSDYARMRVLEEYGGIYLDVDVEVRARFDDLLGLQLFVGTEDQQRFATSIIGVQAGHWLPRHMLSFYDRTEFDLARLAELVNVNEVSRLLMGRGFTGGGGDELRGQERALAIGMLADARGVAAPGIRPIARHFYAGSWRSRNKKGVLSRIARGGRKLPEQIEAWLHLQWYRIGTYLS